ncbi:hypothetical protein ATE84_2483 [Aquimarina sp. MAR_2010_214]|uniref:hypothetical protein n=1 Tax=Aquimarina sp. MAR_2010_214 TaxID=1250026 RepID=UPI000CA7F1DC|nr:hypothetical protein [Aquimarina sp. MAR_2010_214]PKV50426.1 hypothetical protein ATE84_2483 [Aquimarina sp. MAR_2010_214]
MLNDHSKALSFSNQDTDIHIKQSNKGFGITTFTVELLLKAFAAINTIDNV